MTTLVSTRTDLVNQILRENGPYPVGHQSPSKPNAAGWVISLAVLGLVFGWIVLGAIQAPVPDYLVHPLIDTFTDPLVHFVAWVFGW